MEPKNQPFTKENRLKNFHYGVPAVIFSGCTNRWAPWSFGYLKCLVMFLGGGGKRPRVSLWLRKLHLFGSSVGSTLRNSTQQKPTKFRFKNRTVVPCSRWQPPTASKSLPFWRSMSLGLNFRVLFLQGRIWSHVPGSKKVAVGRWSSFFWRWDMVVP